MTQSTFEIAKNTFSRMEHSLQVLYIKKEKCSFVCEGGLANLGHVIKNGTIRMDEKKVQDIREWEPLNKVSE